MIDLSAAPKRIQELMDEGRALDEAIEEAALVGITIAHWWRLDREKFGWTDQFDQSLFDDDKMILEFYHKESGTRWLAKFSGYDAEEVEVFGPVNSWAG